MRSLDHRLLNLKVIGTDQDAAIYNGFSMDNPQLKLHLKKGDSKKILADIYVCQYGSVKELGLADSSAIKKFDSNLDNVKEQWEQLCPGFYKWFVAKQKTFQEKVIEEARKESNVYGLYCNNNVESMHFKEKTEQCHKLRSSVDVINTLKKIIERQQDDEIRAIYGSGPYKPSNE